MLHFKFECWDRRIQHLIYTSEQSPSAHANHGTDGKLTCTHSSNQIRNMGTHGQIKTMSLKIEMPPLLWSPKRKNTSHWVTEPTLITRAQSLFPELPFNRSYRGGLLWTAICSELALHLGHLCLSLPSSNSTVTRFTICSVSAESAALSSL